MCCKHPRSKALFLRRTFADLSKPGAAIDRSHELLTGYADWNGQDHRWTFPNGSLIQFGHLQNANDVYSYQGAQFDRLSWDELTQFTLEQYQFLRSRVRATVSGIKTQIRAATNPGGIGHGWVRQRWIDAAPWGSAFEIPSADPAQPNITACFIPAKVDDNTALLERDPGYKARLSELPEALRKAYLDGNWDIFAGQAFPEWNRDVHVCEPIAIPTEWPRWCAIDYGYSAPFCCLWFARSPEKVVYVYRELYATGLIDREQAERIKELSEGEKIRGRVADPSMWNRQPNGTSIAQVYADNGTLIAPANNDRKAGKQRVHAFLKWGEDRPPSLRVFSSCANLIRTLPALVVDPHDVEDVDTDGEDHAYDSLRYGLMAASAPSQQIKQHSFEVVPD